MSDACIQNMFIYGIGSGLLACILYHLNVKYNNDSKPEHNYIKIFTLGFILVSASLYCSNPASVCNTLSGGSKMHIGKPSF